ncbi:MAG: hypothetical protein H6581_21040 [Bacteroidia bacterium]|nr:hypothetical protein [Bacteroidia bacterium]
MKSEKGKNGLYWALFACLPLLYFFLFGRSGWSDTDQGFIQGLSWRVICGQISYRDFFYVRPPLSLYLHSLELRLLPENHAILLSRLNCYLMMAASVLFFSLSLKKVLSKEENMWNWPLFASLGFVISVHNYPPMPWHTVDGIFFASLGFFLLISFPNWKGMVPGMAALFLAALCKQPFYLAPVLGCVLMALQPDFRVIRLVPPLVTLLLCVGIFLGSLYSLDSRLPGLFLAQTSGSTSLQDLFAAGISPYFVPFLLICALLFTRWILLRWFPRQKWMGQLLQWSPGFYFALALTILMYRAYKTEAFQAPGLGYSQLLLLASVFWGTHFFREKREAATLILALTGISWAAGISWGYPFPIMAATPLLAGSLMFARVLYPENLPRFTLHLALGFCILVSFYLYQFPYRDYPRAECVYNLGDHFPKLSGIKTGPFFYAKYGNLAEELSKLGQKTWMVMPAMPLAHYLHGQSPPPIADWVHNAEINWDKNRAEITRRLDQEVETVFLELDKLDEAEKGGKYGAKLARYVKENWKSAYKTPYFEVYQNPFR